MFLGACIKIEAGKNDGKGYDVVMPTSSLDVKANIRKLFELQAILAAAVQNEDIRAGDQVTLHRKLGKGDTAESIVLHQDTPPLTRTIRIIEPYFKEARTRMGAKDDISSGLASSDMGRLQAASKPFTLCTGENTLAEVVALKKIWLYEVN